MHLLDKKSGRIDRIAINADGTRGIIRPAITTPFDHVTFITQDVTGFLWFGTLTAGLIRYDPITKTSVQYGPNNAASGFTDNSGWWCYPSSDGQVWISTQENSLFQVELFTNKIPQTIIDSTAVIDVAEETDNILWLATINGLVRHNLADGSIQRFRHDPQNPKTISDNIIIGALKDSDGMIWLATQNGLNVLDPHTREIKRYLHDPNNDQSISNNNVQSIFEDSDHRLWFSTYGGGLNRLDKQTEKFTHYVNNPLDTTSLSENLIGGTIQDYDGSLWVSTFSTGINHMNIQTGKVKRYLPGMSVRNHFKDSKGVPLGKY
jgi:ligand-binding sensor domain-containing protein